MSSYREFDGMRLPYMGEALYEKETGPEPYIKARLTSIDFNALRRMVQ
jgi:hypothetical protein